MKRSLITGIAALALSLSLGAAPALAYDAPRVPEVPTLACTEDGKWAQVILPGTMTDYNASLTEYDRYFMEAGQGWVRVTSYDLLTGEKTSSIEYPSEFIAEWAATHCAIAEPMPTSLPEPEPEVTTPAPAPTTAPVPEPSVEPSPEVTAPVVVVPTPTVVPPVVTPPVVAAPVVAAPATPVTVPEVVVKDAPVTAPVPVEQPTELAYTGLTDSGAAVLYLGIAALAFGIILLTGAKVVARTKK